MSSPDKPSEPKDAPAHWFVRSRLKLRQLQLLVALDDLGNIARASHALHLTQPAASKLIKEMEVALGVELFDRLPRGMRATVSGETMVRHARQALASLTQAHQEVQAQRTGNLGSVAIGCIAAPAMSLLPTAVALLKQRHPRLGVEVTVDSSDVLLESLQRDRLDVMVGRLFEHHAKAGLRYVALADEPISVIAAPTHPLLARPGLRLADLARAAWVLPPEGSVLRHRFDLMFREAGLAPPDDLIGTTAHVFMARLLQAGDRLAVVATELAQHFAEHGMLSILPFALPCRMDGFGLITRAERVHSPAARSLMVALHEAALTVYDKARSCDATGFD